MIGVTVNSTLVLAEAAYDLGWKSALAAMAQLAADNPSIRVVDLVHLMNMRPVAPSGTIEKMKAAMRHDPHTS